MGVFIKSQIKWTAYICKYESESDMTYIYIHSGKKIIWSPADFVRLPTEKEMISL